MVQQQQVQWHGLWCFAWEASLVEFNVKLLMAAYEDG
jgi:hypothetical protein